MGIGSGIERTPVKNRGWIVTFAGVGINLALGVLYSWSVISKQIPADWHWSEAGKSLPYSIACLIFSLIMAPAGLLQDRIGPRIVATIGGVMVGAGLIIASLTHTVAGYIIGFGLLAGTGIGFGYASTTPPAIKWFPSARTGFITGIVVSGFGVASVYIAPLANALISVYGVPTAMLIVGIGFFVVIVGFAQLLVIPPSDYVPTGITPTAHGTAVKRQDFTPGEMLKTWQFYILWFMFVCGSGAGLMIISKIAKLAEVQANLKLGFLLVAILALGNGSGRFIAGTVSDMIGRKATMFICFVFQTILILLLSQIKAGNTLGTVQVLSTISFLIGANYGANIALFPSINKDYYGIKNFGANYGLMFTAWGLGGFTLSLLAGWVYDTTGTFAFAYYCSASLLIVAAIVTFIVKPPQYKPSIVINEGLEPKVVIDK